LGLNKALIFPKGDQVVSWGHWDQSLRVCALDTGKVLSVIEVTDDDETRCGDMPKNGSVLVTAGTSCVVKVWKHTRNQRTKTENLKLHSVLYGHSHTVLCTLVSQEWSLILSGSEDKTCIVWDLNRLSYVRSLSGHTGPGKPVAVEHIHENSYGCKHIKRWRHRDG